MEFVGTLLSKNDFAILLVTDKLTCILIKFSKHLLVHTLEIKYLGFGVFTDKAASP